jgi:2-dehydro-3-deoxyphosphooctonate aldolase (KDO 8-P synthase)
MMRRIVLEGITVGGGAPFVLIAGPCVIEDEKRTKDIAVFLKDLCGNLDIPLIFKASYDKANRTSKDGYRGPGLAEGLRILKKIKAEVGLPLLSDVHRHEEVAQAAEVLDILQVPAFLCRQTDLIMDIARHAKVINIKKGQFLAPWDVSNIIGKANAAGNENIMITERGTTFGYNNLVVDFRSLPILRSMGCPVIFDATHAVQLPGGAGTASGGRREMVAHLTRAAAATGIDGLFLEVHPDPDKALCDGPNSLSLNSLAGILRTAKMIDELVKGSM